MKLDFTIKDSFKSFISSGQKEVEPGVFAMYAGNGDQKQGSRTDLNVRDISVFLEEIGMNSSYLIADYDLSGDVNFKDLGLLLSNMGVFAGVPFNSN